MADGCSDGARLSAGEAASAGEVGSMGGETVSPFGSKFTTGDLLRWCRSVASLLAMYCSTSGAGDAGDVGEKDGVSAIAWCRPRFAGGERLRCRRRAGGAAGRRGRLARIILRGGWCKYELHLCLY